MTKIEPEKIWEEYQKGVEYNNKIGLYDTVKKNENFYIGKQWEGVRAGNLEKPVINILRRVVSYFNAMIVSDDVAVSFSPYREKDREAGNILATEIEKIIEDTKFKVKCRNIIRDAAVDGDGCLYFYFDPDAKTGQDALGAVKCELVENQNIMFGNPYSDEIQEQPYLLISMRKTVESVKKEAEANGCKTDDITADNDQSGLDESDGLVTVLIKLWKEDGLIKAVKTTEKAVIKKEWDTGFTMYPVSYMNWERVKRSYHGQSAITAVIPNQIFINKMFAMAMQSVKQMAFPKIFYDNTRIKSWSNSLDDAIGITGDPNSQVYTGFRAPDMSGQVMQIIDKTIELTKETMGASDAALGNVKPDNTSAIIAVQNASAAPLQLQKLGFYQFVEDSVRIMVDIVTACYGQRFVKSDESDKPEPPAFLAGMEMPPEPMQGPMEAVGEDGETLFDFSSLSDMNLRLKVDVGSAAYWSELTQIQTIDNLFSKGIIADAVTYLESIPDAYIKNKGKIIEELKAKQKQAEEMAMRQGMENEVMAALSPEEQAAVKQNPELMQQAMGG